MSQQNESGILSIVAGAARAAFLRVYDNGGTWTTAGAANQADGVQQVPSLAATDIVGVKIGNAPGTRKMMADGIIAAGATVYAGATGYISGAGSIIEGRSLEAAAVAGDIIEVLPLHSADVPSSAGVSTPIVTFNGATGINEIRLTANLADALSIEDTTGDLMKFDTTTGTLAITISADVSIIGGKDLTFVGATGESQLVLTTNLADALSIKDSAADIIVIGTTTGTPTVVITPITTITGKLTASGGITIPGAVDLAFTGTTGQSEIVIPDNFADALSIKDGTGGADLMVFVTTDGSESVNVPCRFSSVGCVANTAGIGITGTAAYYKTSVERIGTIIKTTILIDLAGLNGGGTNDDIIGANGAGVAHLGQHTVAVNGTNIAGKITCLEVPVGSNVDIDLWYADEATGVEDTAISALTGEIKVCNAGNWTLGLVKATDVIVAADKYLYLTSGAATDAAFTAGILLIELYGTA